MKGIWRLDVDSDVWDSLNWFDASFLRSRLEMKDFLRLDVDDMRGLRLFDSNLLEFSLKNMEMKDFTIE